MIMDMRFIRMGGNDKSVLSFGEPHGKFIADFVGQLRRDLSGFEGLTNLIGDHIALLGPAGKLPVLPLGEQELHIGSLGITSVSGYVFSAVCFIRVHGIICSVRKAFRNRPATVDVQGDNPCRGQ